MLIFSVVVFGIWTALLVATAIAEGRGGDDNKWE